MKNPFLVIALVVILGPVWAHSESYFQQHVHYTIHVRLDTENHLLSGRETILYKNNSPDTLSHFYLHIYPNAYKKDSALMSSYRRRFNINLFDLPKSNRSFLEIDSISIDGNAVVLDIDDTVARLNLPQELLPGASMEVSLSFREKVRKHIGRAGYREKQYDIAQWYPKVVVYDENGFHTDKFELGEFYGEFGTFDVFLDIPEHFVVAATGIVNEGDPGWNLNKEEDSPGKNKKEVDSRRSKIVHFHAENVHDFAWCASPDFVVQDSMWNGVKIMSVFRQGNKAWEDTTLAHGIRALEWLTEKVGPYPYPQLSIVQANIDDGMEYPMLVMNGFVSESLVLHEVGHIYFYGALANDERTEAWLDEGATTFQTGWYLQEKYGLWGKKDRWSFSKKITPQYTIAGEARKALFPVLRKDYGERVATRAEAFQNSYRLMVYEKSALVFSALRYVVGPETFERILKTYYDRWKFKHVNEDRFREVCEELSGMDLGWFFEEWLHTRKNCDYRLDEIKTTRRESGGEYGVDVRIKRLGEIVMPMNLEFTLEDGSKKTFLIEGRLRTINKSFELPAKPKRAALNPQNEIMDINLSDNFIPRRRNLQFDWPQNYYFPEDAYQIRYRPGFWYNDIDGFKAGFLLRGSYMNEMGRRRLGIYYGVESQRVDFTASIEKSIRLFANSGVLSLSGYKMEGRSDVTSLLFLRKRKTLIHPPSHDFTIGFNYHELTNTRYIVNSEAYETQADLGPFFVYGVNPQFDILSSTFTAALRLGRDWGAGKFRYEKLTTTFNLHTRQRFVPVDGHLRLFMGLIGGRMPLQQKFFLAGGGPLAQERRFFLRSPGAIWEDLNYHEPGHGNLRGYLPGDFGVNRLLAMNFELGTALPFGFLSKLTGGLLGPIDWAGFVDVGEIMDKQNPNAGSMRIQGLADKGILDATLIDAGLGVRSSLRFPFYKLRFRLDFPFYVNHPEVNGEKDKLRYRYVFSLDAAF